MKKEIENIITIIENALNLKIRGGRGYSAGHPYDAKKVRPVRGKSEYEPEVQAPDNEEDQPVQVSRAFKGEDHDK